MVSYERIDCSQGIDLNKTKESIKCMICWYYYFKSTGFKYQLYVFNGCRDFSMGVMNLSDFLSGIPKLLIIECMLLVFLIKML